MARTITFQKNPLTLAGRVVKEGGRAPDFKVTSQDLKEVTLAAFKDKVKIVSTFPSLDTPVCDLQVKAFNKHAATLSSDVVVVGISKDLPFAQKRFCSDNEIKNETVLSDYKTGSFGFNYGLHIAELNLLARSVMVIDKNDVIRYFAIVPEITTPPDYDAALKALAEAVKAPRLTPDEKSSGCTACAGTVVPLPQAAVQKLIARYNSWEVVEGKKIVKSFHFKAYADAVIFANAIAAIAESEGHHPTISLSYNKVKVILTTHAAGGLTDNDFIMARIIDEAGGER